MLTTRSPEFHGAVQELARERPLLVFDFDGTLAPLVPDRRAAAMRESTAALLRTAALLYPCAVVSGRSRADVAVRVAGAPLVAVIGNCGAEPGFGPVEKGLHETVRRWLPAARALVAGERGVELEDKGLGLALHHRAATDPEGARERLLAFGASIADARVVPGRDVVNLFPASGPTKRDALAWLLGRHSASRAVYVGDDLGDEDVFAAPAVFGIRVAPGDARSAARYALEDQGEIDELLRLLVGARAGLDGRGEGVVDVLGRTPPPRR